ncbi:MAG: zinc-ribbon domain-containing protein [Atopobiaceae bacterium]|nr:zinc-ribbon domain-containing protein [Atopobiaceae bacterium]
MSEYYLDSTDLDVLNERVAELSRIRQDFATHLGSSLYEVTKDDDRLRWGRESLYNGIADCDKEREAILQRIAELESEPVPEAKATDEDESAFSLGADQTIVMKAQPEPSDVPEFTMEAEDEIESMVPEATIVMSAVPAPASEPEPIPTPQPEQEPSVEPEATIVMPAASAPATEPEPEPTPEAAFQPAFNQQLDPIPAPEPMTVPTFVPQPAQASGAIGVTCPNCGAIASAGDKFCMECGTALPAKEEPTSAYAQPIPNICPACGNPVDPSFKFCMTCGHKLS